MMPSSLVAGAMSNPQIMPLSSSSDGANPYGGVIAGSGSLYGTLSAGGAYGCGAIFKFTP